MAADVIKAVRRARPDLLHTHLVHGDIYGVDRVDAPLRVPFVSSRHNDDRYLLGPFRHVDRLFARRARRIIAISDAVRLFLEQAGLPREKLVTVHYGLDALPDAPSERDAGGARDRARRRRLLLAIGRLIAAEGSRDAAACLCPHTRRTIPSAVLAILGSGPLEDETRGARDGNSGSTRRSSCPGRLEIRDWLDRADMFVHTSRWEGFGIVLLEAMLAGLPIVATRVSAVPEVVVDDVTGTPRRTRRRHRAVSGPLSAARRPRSRSGSGACRPASGHEPSFSIARMVDGTTAVYQAATAPSSESAPVRRGAQGG